MFTNVILKKEKIKQYYIFIGDGRPKPLDDPVRKKFVKH